MKYNYVKHLRLMIVFLIIGLLIGIGLSFTIPSSEALQEALLLEKVEFTMDDIKRFINTYRLLYLVILPIALAGTTSGLYLYWSYIKNNKVLLIVSIVLWPIVLLGGLVVGSVFIFPFGAYDVLAILQTRNEE